MCRGQRRTSPFAPTSTRPDAALPEFLSCDGSVPRRTAQQTHPSTPESYVCCILPTSSARVREQHTAKSLPRSLPALAKRSVARTAPADSTNATRRRRLTTPPCESKGLHPYSAPRPLRPYPSCHTTLTIGRLRLTSQLWQAAPSISIACVHARDRARPRIVSQPGSRALSRSRGARLLPPS